MTIYKYYQDPGKVINQQMLSLTSATETLLPAVIFMGIARD